MLDVPSIDEDLAIDGPEFVGAWSEHLRDGVRSLPQRRELVTVFVTLDEAKYQVPNIEGPTPHPTVVVLVQCLLVLGRAEEGNVTRIIELIHGVLEGCLGSLLVVCPNPRRSIVQVS